MEAKWFLIDKLKGSSIDELKVVPIDEFNGDFIDEFKNVFLDNLKEVSIVKRKAYSVDELGGVSTSLPRSLLVSLYLSVDEVKQVFKDELKGIF